MRTFGPAVAAMLCVAATLGAQASRDSTHRSILVMGSVIDSPEMRARLAAPFWEALAKSSCPAVRWTADLSSTAAFEASRQPLLKRLNREVGVLQPRAGNLLARRELYRGPRYVIERVWFGSRVPNATTVAWMVRPLGLETQSAPVLLLHGSGMAPQEAFNWQLGDQYTGNFFTRFDSTAFVGAAIELAEAGYTVVVPWLADDKTSMFWPQVQWQYLNRAGALLSGKLNLGGPFYYLSNDASGAIDFLLEQPGIDPAKVSVIGWGEGAQVAAATAAKDRRVAAVVRLGAPLDRRALRSTAFGVFVDAAFMHSDCALGDVEMAAMVAPRPLLYAYSVADQSVKRVSAFISARAPAEIAGMYRGLGASSSFAIQSDTSWAGRNMRRMRTWLDSAVKFVPRAVPATLSFPPAPSQVLSQSQYIDSTKFKRGQFVARLGPCVEPRIAPDFISLTTYEASVEPLREQLRQTLRVPVLEQAATVRILRRDTVKVQGKYLLEFVQFQSSRTSIPISGLLATPFGLLGARAPAVISVDANYGLAGPFGLLGPEPVPYLNAYADNLASNGQVVFAPYIPNVFPEIAPSLLRARNPDGPTSWTYLIPQYVASVDFVLSQPRVDSTRVGMWGISFAAFPALFTTALDTRISALVFSNPTATAALLFRDPGSTALAPWYGEICSMIDPALTYLIAPRRLIRENGRRDTNGYERVYLESIDRIRQVYGLLGVSSHFQFYQHPGGHETLARSLF